jgi:hypothetical protein
MNLKLLKVCGIACCLMFISNASAAESGLPGLDVLKSATVIDCGQWPAENDADLAESFGTDCKANGKLLGYKQAWALKMENAPEEALKNPGSFPCPSVVAPNIGYVCLGKK